MDMFEVKPMLRVVALAACTLVVSGCSGSGSSSASGSASGSGEPPSNEVSDDESLSDVDNDVDTQDDVIDDVVITEVDTESPVEPEPTNSEEPTIVSDDVTEDNVVDEQEVDEPAEESESEDSDLDTLDPAGQNSTTVYFNITVPAYQSNSLQVQLLWGEYASSATWIGDELWQVSAEFPANTEHLLSVTFYDDNGATPLANYSQAYATGANDVESYQITADQFDTDQFDTDDDGTNNLDELIGGTDPQTDESSLLEIREIYTLPSNVLSVSQELEAGLVDARPYFNSRSEFNPVSEDEDSVGTSINEEVDIDENGNATVSFYSYAPWFRESHSGTRTNTGSSIKWGGGYSTYDGDYGRSRTFTNEVIIVDDITREYIQQVSEEYSGTYRDTWETSNNLTGELIEGTSLCKPVSGTLTRAHGTNRSGFPFRTATTTISKEADDTYWTVVLVNLESERVEFLARELVLYHYGPDDDPKYPTFICDFVDF